MPAFADLKKENVEATPFEGEGVILVRRGEGAVVAFNFAEEERTLPLPEGRWEKILDSADGRWGGPGMGERLAPRSVAVFTR